MEKELEIWGVLIGLGLLVGCQSIEPALPNFRSAGLANQGDPRIHSNTDKNRKKDQNVQAPDEFSGIVASATNDKYATAYLRAVYRLNRIDVPKRVQTPKKLYETCRKRRLFSADGGIHIGDTVLFHNTEDRNQDERNNDWFTYTAIVEDKSGAELTLRTYHREKIRDFKMNLERPSVGDKNTSLRPKRPSDPLFTRYLSGQLYAGHCNFLGDRSHFVILDRWHPEMALPKPPETQVVEN